MPRGIRIIVPNKCRCGFGPRPAWVMKRHFETRPRSCNLFKGVHQHTAKQRQRLSRQRSLPKSGSRVLVLQNDDREDGYIKPLRALNQFWAKRQGYNYRFLKSGGYSRMPPWWRKVFLVRDACRKGHTVIYLDSDAVWHDPDAPLEMVATRHGTEKLQAGIYIGKGVGFWKPVDANAGVFIAHGRRGKELMEAWCALYTNEVAQKWTASMSSNRMHWQWSGAWAGETFEQGAFVKHLLNRPGVHAVPWGILNSHSIGQVTRCLVKHFYGPHKANINAYLQSRR